MSNDANRNSGWRPWQFSLRTLIVLMLCVACFFGGWQAHQWQVARDQQRNTTIAPQQMSVRLSLPLDDAESKFFQDFQNR